MFNIKGKVAIITGGSKGIGRSSAILLAQNGAIVVIASRNKYGDLDETAAEIRDLGGEVLPVQAHVGSKSDIDNLVNATLQKYGKIDILINNAAINPILTELVNLPEKAWDKIMDVNLKGCYLLSQLAAREMIKQKSGTIINVSSDGGIVPAPNLLAYCISKAGLIMLGQGLAKELGKYNIRVNNVVPGLIETRTAEALWQDPEFSRRRLERTCLGRTGTPEEVASVILFLASDASSYMTGATIPVEAGTLVSTMP